MLCLSFIIGNVTSLESFFSIYTKIIITIIQNITQNKTIPRRQLNNI